jgi:glucosamine-6-phosphate deaminase
MNGLHIDQIEKLRVMVLDSRRSLGKIAARMVSERINDVLKVKTTVNIIFAAAPSQNEFLDELAANSTIPWSLINGFHMDEYLGLPDSSPQRFGHFLDQKLFSKLPFHTVNYINGNTNDPQAECTRYAALLKANPADIVCMGIGENTHIAFNDPHVADFKDPMYVKQVTLDRACRQQQVNDGCFRSITEVPQHALTLTIPALMSASFVYCMVPGRNKSSAALHTLNEPVTEKYPSTILRQHDAAVLLLDSDSAVLLNDIPKPLPQYGV